MAAPNIGQDKLDDLDRVILRHLENGLTNRQIAGRIDRAEGTVNNRIMYAMHRTGAKTRTQLVVMYVKGEI